MPTEESLEHAHRFILREKMGKLRSWNTYIPPVLRMRYLELLDEIATELGVRPPIATEEKHK